jgi:hypothetical protein
MSLWTAPKDFAVWSVCRDLGLSPILTGVLAGQRCKCTAFSSAHYAQDGLSTRPHVTDVDCRLRRLCLEKGPHAETQPVCSRLRHTYIRAQGVVSIMCQIPRTDVPTVILVYPCNRSNSDQHPRTCAVTHITVQLQDPASCLPVRVGFDQAEFPHGART